MLHIEKPYKSAGYEQSTNSQLSNDRNGRVHKASQIEPLKSRFKRR